MTARVTLKEAAAYLLSSDNFLILSHRRPDGDTVGSCAALCRALRALGKQAWVYANPQFTPKFAPYLEGLVFKATGTSASSAESPVGSRCESRTAMPEATSHAFGRLRQQATEKAFPLGGRCHPASPASRMTDEGTFDDSPVPCIVSCDIASRSLLPFGMEDAAVELALDHHGTNDSFAARTHADERRAACGEVILELLPLLGAALTKEMAEALYVAISTDTGCFRYSNVTANTLRCAAACVDAGAEIFPINRSFFELKRRPRLALEAYLIRTMEYFAEGRVAVSAIPQALMEELGLTEDDVDDISGFGRSIEGVELAVMLREVEGGQGKISLRSSPAFNAAAICARLGGGGHPGAAGASVPGGIPAAREAILKAIGEEIAL